MLKGLSFLHWITFLRLSINWLYMYESVSGLSILFYSSICLLFCLCHAELINEALQYSPEVRYYESFSFLFSKLLWNKIVLVVLVSFFLFSIFLKFIFICLFLAALGLRCCARAFSLVAASGGYVVMRGLLLRCLPLLWSTGSRHAGFSSCGSQALKCGLSSCGAQA